MLAEIQEDLERLDTAFKRKEGERNILLLKAESLSVEIEERKKRDQIFRKVIELFNSIGGKQRELLKKRIEVIVTYGLRSVFQKDLNFKIEIGEQRGYPTMDFFIESGGKQRPVMGFRGGGYVDVCGYILQMLVVVLMKSRVRQFVMFDEALVHLSSKYRERMFLFKRELCDKLGIQMVFITQQREYLEIADRGYLFELDSNDFTRIEQIK